jgi:hypothetical protein
MDLFGIFKRRSTADRNRIKTKHDVVAFFQEATKDADLAAFLTDVVEHIGRHGYIEVRRGGSGMPYAAEYQVCPSDDRRREDVQAELNDLQESLKTAISDDERDRIERQIAQLAGGVCTVWINTMLSIDFEERSHLVADSFRRFKESING